MTKKLLSQNTEEKNENMTTLSTSPKESTENSMRKPKIKNRRK